MFTKTKVKVLKMHSKFNNTSEVTKRYEISETHLTFKDLA